MLADVTIDDFVKMPISALRFPATGGTIAATYYQYASLHEIRAP